MIRRDQPNDYQEALGILSEAENASHWGSEVENTLNLSSSEDESQSLLTDLYPPPPAETPSPSIRTTSHIQNLSFSPKFSSTQKDVGKNKLSLATSKPQAMNLQRCEEESLELENSFLQPHYLPQTLSAAPSPSILKRKNVCSSPKLFSSLHSPLNKRLKPGATCTSTSGVATKHSDLQHYLEVLNLNLKSVIADIKILKDNQDVITKNQQVMLQQQQDLTVTLLRLDSKSDSLLKNSQKENIPTLNEIMDLLPASAASISTLENKLKESNSLRIQMKQLLIACSGRDGKSMVSACLKKIMTDEAALKYSLTGRNVSNVEKIPFEATVMYLVIKEVVLHIYKDTKESVFRDAISEWFIHAKFRIARRDKTIERLQ